MQLMKNPNNRLTVSATRSLLLLVLILLCTVGRAQKHDYNWVFDDSIGISFKNVNAPTVFTSAIHGILAENYASVSDSSGDLMFYINGSDSPFLYSCIFNKLGKLMQNGDSIPSDRSSTQGALILPFPNNSSKYYYLYLSRYYLNDGLYYAIVDMSQNAGAGKVISKNNLIIKGSLTEKLTAVRHGNGRDWWIFTHGDTTREFKSVLLSPSGFSQVMLQSIGSKYGDFSSGGGDQGQMVFSPDGTHLCAAGMGHYGGLINLFDFDRCSGMLNNWKDINIIDSVSYGFYGCSFSPDGTKLYVSEVAGSISQPRQPRLFQYKLTSSNVSATRTLLLTGHQDYSFVGHLLGPDNKIYVSTAYYMMPNSVYSTYNMNLTIINAPDSTGTKCDVRPYSFYLGGKRIFGTLPNMVNYRLKAWKGSTCEKATVNSPVTQLPIEINPNPAVNALNIRTHCDFRTTVVIWDLTSRKVAEQTFVNETILDIAQLQPGVYFYEIVSPKGIVGKGKFVK